MKRVFKEDVCDFRVFWTGFIRRKIETLYNKQWGLNYCNPSAVSSALDKHFIQVSNQIPLNETLPDSPLSY